MKTKDLQFIRPFWLLIFVLFMGMGTAWATYDYDFTAVAPSGQTLCFDIISSTDHTVGVVSPNQPANYPWGNYVEGDLVIPSEVSYNGETYTVTALLNNHNYGALQGTGLTSVVIPETVNNVQGAAFYGSGNLSTIICLATIPPSSSGGWEWDTWATFVYLPENCVLYVPEGSVESYQADDYWNALPVQAIDGQPHEIQAVAVPSEYGTVSGAGTYEWGSSCTLTATANEGYIFLYWTENGTRVSYNAEYTLTVTEDRSLEAHFAEEGSICNLVFYLYDSYGDGWNGNKLVVNYADGTYDEITLNGGSSGEQTLFVVNGSHITLTWINGSYINECSFTMCYSNGNVIYHGENMNSDFSYEFDVDCEGMPGTAFGVTATAEPIEGGLVNGAGSYGYGSTCTLTATANESYTFMYWTENGQVVSNEAEYSFIVTGDRDLVAHFTLPFTITAIANPIEGGTVVGAESYDYGSTCTLTASPNDGYIFLYWTEDGTRVSYNAEYTFTVTEDRSLEAHFAEEGSICHLVFYLYDSYGDGWNGNKLVVNYADGTYDEITLNGGSSGEQTLFVVNGSHITLTWINGYYINECSFTMCYSNGNVIYHGENMNSDFSYEFDVDCEGMPGTAFGVTATAEPIEGGLVNGAGSYGYGSTCTLTATANEGYTFMYWTENGQVVSDDAEYSFTVSGDRNLVANFVEGYVTSITIGNGTYTDERVPITGWHANKYEKCEYVVPQSLIASMAGSMITSIKCYSSSSSNSFGNAVFRVFMKTIDTPTLNDFMGENGATVVYEGGLSVSNGELIVQFTTPYSYNGGNLLIGFYEVVQGSSSTCYFYGQSVSNASIVGWDYYSLDNIILDDDYTYSSDVQFPNFLPKTTFTYTDTNEVSYITATASPCDGGIVTGAGEYTIGDTCTLTATANEGYTFVNWTENGGVVSTDVEYTFIVTGDRMLVANFAIQIVVPTGAINGRFSVSESNQVSFSQGNLQYQASTNTWRFAESQWDIVGSSNSNISSTYSGWIDLFGWGTSNWNNGNVNYHPWNSSNAMSQWTYYGPNGLYDLTGQYANSDWGVYNAISNGGNQSNSWRTLSKDEWDYVFNSRNTPSGIRYAKAVVNEMSGVILLPDTWDGSYYSLNNVNSESAEFNSNTVSETDWFDYFESNGAVFLPNAGARAGTSVVALGRGSYWSSSYFSNSEAYSTFFTGQNCAYAMFIGDAFLGTDYNHRCDGLSVRLVSDINYRSIEVVPNPVEGGSVLGAGMYYVGSTCTLTATTNEGYTFLSWTKNGVLVSTDTTYTFTVTNDASFVANFGKTQTITLSAGWNWFSTYLAITLDNLKAALVDALPSATTISIVSQSDGSTTYNGNQWRGQLTSLDLAKMYMIKVNTGCEITLIGMPINPGELSITIHSGNNWIAFPFSQNMSLTDAFAGFAASGDIIISQAGSSAYLGNRWRGTVTDLVPGKGYNYNSNVQGDRILVFPTIGK